MILERISHNFSQRALLCQRNWGNTRDNRIPTVLCIYIYEGGSKSPCNHIFSLYMQVHLYKGGSVYLKHEPLSFMPCNMDSVARLVALRN